MNKQEQVMAALKKNSTSLANFDQWFRSKADRKKDEIVRKFVENCGVLPDEAVLCLGPDPDQTAGETVNMKIWVQRRDGL